MEKPKCLVDRHHGSEPIFDLSYSDRRKYKIAYDYTLMYDVGNIHKRTHEAQSTLNCLNRVYPHAIEIDGVDEGSKKWGFILGLAFSIIFTGLFLHLFIRFYRDSGSIDIFTFLPLLFVFVGVLFGWWVYRYFKWNPGGAPVLFNRKTRQVIALQTNAPNFLKVWEAGKTKLSVLPWENFRVRVYRYRAGKYSRSTFLALLWGKKNNPEQLREIVQLVSLGSPQGDELFKLWEHVRQYMDEDGLPIQPGESLGANALLSNLFPADIIEAAGGHAYSHEKVYAMAERNDKEQ